MLLSTPLSQDLIDALFVVIYIEECTLLLCILVTSSRSLIQFAFPFLNSVL